MKWEGITEFVYVAEAESFTKAAKKLAVSTAQASRQISALEKRLNTRLFYRTTRKVSLTEEGRIFYQHCRRVLDDLEAAKLALSHLQSKPQGNIQLTAPVTYGEQHILPLVNDFIKRYPDVSVNAHLSNQQIDLVNEGYDLAIRIGELSDSSMMAEKLGSRTNYLCASPGYLAQHGTPKNLSQLEQHNCLLGTLDYWRFQESSNAKKLKVTGSLRYNNGRGLVDAALKGLGIVQLPDYYVEQHITSGALITLLDNYKDSDEGIWAVYPLNRNLSPKIRIFIDFLIEHLSTNTQH